MKPPTWLQQMKPPDGGPPPADQRDRLPPDTLGLALSGGGVRSAAFCLGVLQALARAGWLKHVDYLSTVSGGGYIGAFLGRFFDLLHSREGLGGPHPDDTPGAAQDRVARDLADSRSRPVSWLARNANYLSPTGLGEAFTNLAGFWRNLLSVYLVLGFFLFAILGLLNAVAYGYGGPRAPVGALLGDFLGALMPLTRMLPPAWAGPWTGAAEVVLWAAVVPLMLAYWLVSQDLHEAFVPPVLTAAAAVAVAVLLASVSLLSVAVLSAAVLWAMGAWAAVRRAEGHFNPLNRFRLMLTRNHLTGLLAFWLGVAAALAAFGAVDSAGRMLAGLMLEGGLTAGNVSAWFAMTAGAVIGLASLVRGVASHLVAHLPARASILLAARPFLLPVVVLVFGALPPLVALSFASHVAYECGASYHRGLAATAVAAAVSFLLGRPECVPFLNRSGPLAVYAARLARAFLGAVNPQRRYHPEGRNVAHVVPGDDAALAEYTPHKAGGPLHLINCSVNETIDVASERGMRDRQAENMSVGPAGVSVAQRWHAVWVPAPGGRALEPLEGSVPHPFLGRDGRPVPVEELDLREWVAISGAALAPGLGRRTGLATALLLTLANLRLGYWWDSALYPADRRDVPVKRGPWQALAGLVSRVFRTQFLILQEAIGRFGGPWHRYWYLSDGGNFEVTGGYELLRRRVPFAIICDAGEDPRHQGADFARLARLARVDLGAEFQELTEAELVQLGLPPPVAARLGRPADLLPGDGTLPSRHAALLLVRYPNVPGATGAWNERRHTWLLYIKATRTGDEPLDVRSYAEAHPDFPDETTFDQVFDEPQWESYRKLGEHIGAQLFTGQAAEGNP